MPFFKVCLLNDLSETKLKMFEIDGVEILFVKLHFHNIIRLSNSCEVRMKHQVMFFHA